MEHRCIALVNAGLKERNTKLALGFNMSGEVFIIIGSEKVDPKIRVKPAILYAVFCPFCGERIVNTDGKAKT